MDYAIWFETFRNGEKCGSGVYHKRYQRKGNAIRTAMKYYDRTIVYDNHTITYKWVVSQENPWSK